MSYTKYKHRKVYGYSLSRKKVLRKFAVTLIYGVVHVGTHIKSDTVCVSCERLLTSSLIKKVSTYVLQHLSLIYTFVSALRNMNRVKIAHDPLYTTLLLHTLSPTPTK